MKNAFKPLLFSLIVLIIGFSVVISQGMGVIAQNAPTNSVETQGKPNTNPAIEQLPSRGINDRDSPRPAPPRTRGGGYPCQIFFRNTTALFIDLYANDEFIGTISPYGDSSIPATPGGFELFGKSEFRDGSILTWGPQRLSLRTGDTFTWTLR